LSRPPGLRIVELKIIAAERQSIQAKPRSVKPQVLGSKRAEAQTDRGSSARKGTSQTHVIITLIVFHIYLVKISLRQQENGEKTAQNDFG
jgi:hypothetical protein